jgi:hypothetical protein
LRGTRVRRSRKEPTEVPRDLVASGGVRWCLSSACARPGPLRPRARLPLPAAAGVRGARDEDPCLNDRGDESPEGSSSMGSWTNSPSLRGRRWPSVAACLRRTRGHPATGRAPRRTGARQGRPHGVLHGRGAGGVREAEARRAARCLQNAQARGLGELGRDPRGSRGPGRGPPGRLRGRRAVCEIELLLSRIAGWRM